MKVMKINESVIEDSKAGHLIADLERGFGFLCLDPDDDFMEMPYEIQKKIIEDWVELLGQISTFLESTNGGSIQ
jgi:hypothetical protein